MSTREQLAEEHCEGYLAHERDALARDLGVAALAPFMAFGLDMRPTQAAQSVERPVALVEIPSAETRRSFGAPALIHTMQQQNSPSLSAPEVFVGYSQSAYELAA